jgi:hypothetical protein
MSVVFIETLDAGLWGCHPLASRMAGDSQASGTLAETSTIGAFIVDFGLCRSTIKGESHSTIEK